MSLPYFPMFPTDFEAKTSHLSLEEDGAYNRLLRLMWMTPGCSLPDDDAWIMRRMRCDAETYERVVRVVIDEFCTRKNGRVSNAKLTRIFGESNQRHERRVSAGSKGARAKALKTKETASSNAEAMHKQPKPKPELDNSEPNGSDGDAVIADATKDAIWKRGVPYLVENGVPERQARSAIGKWIRDAGAQRLYDALAQSKSSGTGDPIPYITEILKPEPDNEQIMRDIVARVRARRREGASA